MSEPAPVPAVVAPAPRDLELDRLARLGQWLAASETGATDEKSRGMTAALRLYYVEQLGLPPLAASEFSIVKGRLFPHAKLLRALAGRAGYRVERVDEPDQCTAVLYDAAGTVVGRSTFTLEDAQRAKLVKDGSAWQAHPARMLWARACKFVLDDYAPQVTLGVGLEDEIEEIEPRLSHGEWVPPEAGLEEAVDGVWVPAGEPVPVEDEEGRKTRLHRRLAVLCDKAETDSKMLLPEGQDSWEGYSRWLAQTQYGVESRAELSADQLADLVDQVQAQMVPF